MVQRQQFGYVQASEGIAATRARCWCCGDRCDKGIEIESMKGEMLAGRFCSWECKQRGVQENANHGDGQ